MGSLAGVVDAPLGRPGLQGAAAELPLLPLGLAGVAADEAGEAAAEAMDDAGKPPPVDGGGGGPRAGGVRGLAAVRRAFAGVARRARCRAHRDALARC